MFVANIFTDLEYHLHKSNRRLIGLEALKASVGGCAEHVL